MKNRALSRNEINYIIKRFRITIDRFEIDQSGRLNVFGSVRISDTKLKRLPLRFGKVSGDFHCYLNHLTTLEGAPHKVGGDFNCSGNLLKSLKHAPQEVDGDFFCQENVLEKLDGAPRIINGNFNCFLNNLKNLKNGPFEVKKSYYAYANQLNTLEGSPRFVGKSFFVVDNNLSNLVGCPSYIGETLSFDRTINSIDLGINNCIVKKVEIQGQEVSIKKSKMLSQIILDNQKYLPIVFKYHTYLELFDRQTDKFSLINFKGILEEIKEGLR